VTEPNAEKCSGSGCQPDPIHVHRQNYNRSKSGKSGSASL
jgi:hypothetical protein